MIWMTMTTMTTVGYGDYVPQTPVGRIIGSLCITWGALILSVTVVVLTSAFSMNRSTTTFNLE
jgi:voltage-gated potassium channel